MRHAFHTLFLTIVLCVSNACGSPQSHEEPVPLSVSVSDAELALHRAIRAAPYNGFNAGFCVLSAGAAYADKARTMRLYDGEYGLRVYTLIEELETQYKVSGANPRKEQVWLSLAASEADFVLLYVDKRGAERLPIEDARCV